MNGISKRIIAIATIVLVLIGFCSFAQAADLGQLTYWYSDASSIGRWTSSPRLYTKKLNSNTAFYLSAGTESARTQWNSALGLSIYSTTESAATIVFYGGTKNEIESSGLFYLTSDVLGITEVTNSSYEGTYTWNSSTKTGLIYRNAKCALVDRGLTANECRKTSTHELGHALGYDGHDSYYSSVMTQGQSSVYSLNSGDINHLKQVY